jgi:hypothetical protein
MLYYDGRVDGRQRVGHTDLLDFKLQLLQGRRDSLERGGTHAATHCGHRW